LNLSFVAVLFLKKKKKGKKKDSFVKKEGVDGWRRRQG